LSTLLTINEALSYFDGHVKSLADAMGVTTAAVYYWKKNGRMPDLQAFRFRHEVLPRIKENA